MARSIDINGDLGEGIIHQDVPVDELLMPHLSSVSIACGGHAGDEDSIAKTIRLARQHKVAIGAHPSFPDRENFGRKHQSLTPGALASEIAAQLERFLLVAKKLDTKPQHIKAHGALYHAAAQDESIAEAIARAVRWLEPALVIFGLPDSALERVAMRRGLRFAAEAFPDRAYQDDGSLVARSEAGAIISDPAIVGARARSLAVDGRIQSISGRWIIVRADTLCLHGDSPDAPELARSVRDALTKDRVEVGLTCAHPALRIEPLGEEALRVICGNEISDAVTSRVRAIDAYMRSNPLPGVIEIVPAYTDLAVFFDPAIIRGDDLAEIILIRADGARDIAAYAGREHIMRVRYGGKNGPDLDAVAKATGLSPDEVIQRHANKVYPVHMLGFSPGFCYLGGLDPSLEVARRSEPRVSVPAGSVAIAGQQTGIYPMASPGGWNIIGSVDEKLFDPQRENPFLVQAGDTVRFEPLPEGATQNSQQETAEKNSRDAAIAHEKSTSAPFITIESPGMLTTVQDRGRAGYRRFGLPAGGALDSAACRRANDLLGNSPDAAMLEITMTGPVIRFGADVRFVITGARMQPALNGHPIEQEVVTLARDGDVLNFGALLEGCRAYVGFAGGIDSPLVMGSRSTCLAGGFGGHKGRALLAGDRLFIGNMSSDESVTRPAPACAKADGIRIMPGPEVDWFTPEALANLLATPYRIAPESNRAGYRLKGASLSRRYPDREMISSPVTTGTIQINNDGQPIILLADGPTVGGYPRIGIVTQADLSRLAQLRPGDALRFLEINAPSCTR